jgi:RNA polymerase sigma factor (sigma-70 family)
MGIWIVIAIQIVLSIAALVAALLALAWARAGARDGSESRKLVEAFFAALHRDRTHSGSSTGVTVLRRDASTRRSATTAPGPLVVVPPPRDEAEAPELPHERVIITPAPTALRLPPPRVLPGVRALTTDPRELYSLARGALRRYRGRFTKSELDDLCQEIVFDASKRRHTYDPSKGNIAQWFAGIARYCVSNYVGKRPAEVLWSDLHLDPDSMPAPEVDDTGADMLEALQRALAILSVVERRIVTQYAIDGKTYVEIGLDMKMSQTAVRRYCINGLARLRKLLTKK